MTEGAPAMFTDDGHPFEPANLWFLELARPKTASPNTWRAYAYALRQFLDFCAVIPVDWDKVSRETVLAYWRTRRLMLASDCHITANSWNIHAAAIHGFYEFAGLRGLMKAAPFRKSDLADDELWARANRGGNPLKERGFRLVPKWISIPDYVDRVRPAALRRRNGHRDAALMDLMITTGWRLREAASQVTSEWPDPDQPNYRGRTSIPFQLCRGCKGNVPREVLTPLRKSVVRDVRRFIQGDRAEFVFRAELRDPTYGSSEIIWLSEEGEVPALGSLGRQVRLAFDAAGLDGSAHTLRHTFAVHQLQSSARRFLKDAVLAKNEEAFRQAMYDPLRRLQKLLGHRWLHTTSIYLDMLPDIDTLMEMSLEDWSAAVTGLA